MENHRGFINIINRSRFPASHKQGDTKTANICCCSATVGFFPSLLLSSLGLGGLYSLPTLAPGRKEGFKEGMALALCLEREMESTSEMHPTESLKTTEMIKYGEEL